MIPEAAGAVASLLVPRRCQAQLLSTGTQGAAPALPDRAWERKGQGETPWVYKYTEISVCAEPSVTEAGGIAHKQSIRSVIKSRIVSFPSFSNIPASGFQQLQLFGAFC